MVQTGTHTLDFRSINLAMIQFIGLTRLEGLSINSANIYSQATSCPFCACAEKMIRCSYTALHYSSQLVTKGQNKSSQSQDRGRRGVEMGVVVLVSLCSQEFGGGALRGGVYLSGH